MTLAADRRAGLDDPTDTALVGVAETIRRAAADRSPAVRRVVGHLPATSGKAVRPRLVLLLATCGGRPLASAVDVAAGVELIHLATLHHDDVVDQSRFRRNLESTWSLWGNNSATFAGTYLLAKGVELLSGAGDLVNVAAADCLAELWHGQTAELVHAHRPGRTREDYLRIIGQKTGSLFELACRSGALVGGAPDCAVDTAAQFGRVLGTAFQLADDILDVIGDSRCLGKPTGSDIPAGIYTLPVIEALGREAPQHERLLWLLNRTAPRAEELDEAAQLVQLLGGICAAKQELWRQVDLACELGRGLPGSASAYLLSIANEVARSVEEHV